MLKSLDRLVKETIQGGVNVRMGKAFGSIIPGLRNELAKKAIDINSDYLLFIDSDMVFGSDFLLKLLKYERDIISGLCVVRTAPYKPVAKVWIDGKGYVPRDRLDEGRFYTDLDMVGCAFMLIKADVFKKMEQPWFAMPPHGMAERYVSMAQTIKQIKDNPDNLQKIMDKYDADMLKYKDLNGIMGEDAYFCRKAKAMGYDVCIDTSLVVGHIGEHPFTIYDYLNYKKEREEQQKEKELSVVS